MEHDGELVESGTFRVDRKRALEKLQQYQLSDPAMFLLPWVRCAVASGATAITIQVNHQKTHLTMSFDGRPFTPAELRDPYGCLLDESTPRNAPNRNLAVGILAALQLGPAKVKMTSGVDSERRCLQIESLEQETFGEAQGSARGTVLEVTFSGHWMNWKAALETVVRQYPVGLRTARLSIVEPADFQAKAESRGRPQRTSAPLSFSDGAVRGLVAVPEDPHRAQSTVRLYQYGVLVEEIESDVPPVPVVAAINNDRFRLNASQSGIVRDDQFEVTMQTVVDQTKQLLVKVSQAQGAILTAVHRLLSHPGGLGRRLSIRLRSIWEGGLSSGLQGIPEKRPAADYVLGPLLFAPLWLWMLMAALFGFRMGILGFIIGMVVFVLTVRWIAWTQPWTQLLNAGAGGILRESEHQVLNGAWSTALLRKACWHLLHEHNRDSSDPTLKALWEAPIFLGVDGTPLSLAEVELQRRQMGHVPVSTEPSLQRSARGKVVWCVGERDRTDLEQFFPGQTRM